MKMKTLTAALSGALLLGTLALTPAYAANTDASAAKDRDMVTAERNALSGTKDRTVALDRKAGNGDSERSEKDRIEADAKAAKERCKPMEGNAQDICEAEAEGQEKVAKAELEARRKGNTAQANYDVKVAKAKAEAKIAKEKCDDMEGDRKDACQKQAKADESKAIAAAKEERKVASKDSEPAPRTAARTGSSASTSMPESNVARTQPSPGTSAQAEGTSTGKAGTSAAVESGSANQTK